MFAAGAVLTLLGAVLTPGGTGPGSHGLLAALAALCLVVSAVLVLSRGALRDVALIAAPLLGSLVIAAVDLATADGSAAAQVLFCMPVIYGATYLPPPLSWLSTLGATMWVAVVAFSLQPRDAAINDVVFVGVALCLVTHLMLRAQGEAEALVARLEQLATVDPLTGLCSRRVLDDAVAVLGAGRTGAVLMLVDVDDFKAINDEFGHPAGDDALVLVARLLRTHAPPDVVLSRLGGDEFAALLPGHDVAEATRYAEEFVTALRETPLLVGQGRRVTMSVSVGIAASEPGETDARRLYAAADASLYEVKRSGRGRVAGPPGTSR